MIPAFELSGALPPYIGHGAPQLRTLSPYPATVLEVVQRFGGSPERRRLLNGLLTYRQVLVTHRMSVGFQWIAGSFTEDIEAVEGRPPNDIEIVTFFRRPAVFQRSHLWGAFVAANPSLFDPQVLRATYGCHAFPVDMDAPVEQTVDATRYYKGLFSHRRTRLWKGLVRIELGTDDADAAAHLRGNP